MENEFLADRKVNTGFLISLAFTDPRALKSGCVSVDDTPTIACYC